MCWGVYLASPGPLRLIPWDASRPALSAIPLKKQYESVRKQFRFENVVELGSQTQCGCGFIDTDDGADDPRRAVVSELVSYLGEALAVAPELEMFVCWEGGEAGEPAARLQLTPSAFQAETFPLGDDIQGGAGYARIAL
jgi:hypothetical protein